MVALPQTADPTLDLADRAIEQRQERRRRAYLGMSAIGGECERALWYGFRWVAMPAFDAATLKRFEDGHASEDVAVRRLKAVPGVDLRETDDGGHQWSIRDMGGHFSGHMDGVILGVAQAPKTWHVLEIKASEKWTDLDKAVKKVGVKNALADWNPTYYAQAVLYMDYAGLDRHYLVCVSPGARRWTSVRTDADPAFAIMLKAKAERIIFSDHAPKRIGGPDSFACRWCDFAQTCHAGSFADRNCRTCLHVSVERDGEWRCTKFGHNLSRDDQEAGCSEHRYLPDLVTGDQIDATETGISYRTSAGEWVDRGPGSELRT